MSPSAIFFFYEVFMTLDEQCLEFLTSGDENVCFVKEYPVMEPDTGYSMTVIIQLFSKYSLVMQSEGSSSPFQHLSSRIRLKLVQSSPVNSFFFKYILIWYPPICFSGPIWRLCKITYNKLHEHALFLSMLYVQSTHPSWFNHAQGVECNP